MQGFIKLHRKLLNNPIWNRKPFSPGQAWIDLLLLAQFKEITVTEPNYGKTQVPLKRGELATSERILSERWGWKRGRIRSHLNAMVRAHMIKVKKCTLYTVVSILYYDSYQGPVNGKTPTLQPSDNPAGAQVTSETLSQQGITTPKNVKKLKNTTVRGTILFWKLAGIYPKGMNKAVSRRAWDKLNPSEEQAEEIINHVSRRKEKDRQWLKNNGQFIPMLSTFLNNRRWEDTYEEAAGTTDNRNLEV